MADYIPASLDWVRKQVELYEGSRGTDGYVYNLRANPSIELRGLLEGIDTEVERDPGRL